MRAAASYTLFSPAPLVPAISPIPAPESKIEWLRRPVLAPLLRHGLALRLTVAGCMGYAALAAAGFGFIPCAFRAVTHCDCPTCGLTRSAVAGLRGDWVSALRWHALGPPLLLLGLCGIVACFLPQATRSRLADWLGRHERRWFLPAVGAGVLVAYWLVRLMLGCAPSDLAGPSR